MPFCRARSWTILVAGFAVRWLTMRMLIALLAVALMPTLAELSLGAGQAQAAASCRQSYNVCLARCAAKQPKMPALPDQI